MLFLLLQILWILYIGNHSLFKKDENLKQELLHEGFIMIYSYSLVIFSDIINDG